MYPESNDNGNRLVDFATSKNLIVKSTRFPHRNIHKHTCTSPDGITHNQIDHVLVDKRRQSNIDICSLRAVDCDMVATIKERLSLKKGIKQHLIKTTLSSNQIEISDKRC